MQEDDQLFKKLQEKWNIKEVEEPSKPVDQRELIRELIEKSKERPQFKIKKLQDQSDNQTGVLLPENYNKNEQVPLELINIVQRNPRFPGVVNIGQEMVNTINSSIDHKKKVYQMQKKNFILTQALRGKLGVDLFAISFGIFGLAIIPIYFWLKQRNNSSHYMNEMELVARVKDFEESQLDLDDVSNHKTYYNLFTAEIRAIINKKNEMNKEINKLLGRSS